MTTNSKSSQHPKKKRNHNSKFQEFETIQTLKIPKRPNLHQNLLLQT